LRSYSPLLVQGNCPLWRLSLEKRNCRTLPGRIVALHESNDFLFFCRRFPSRRPDGRKREGLSRRSFLSKRFPLGIKLAIFFSSPKRQFLGGQEGNGKSEQKGSPSASLRKSLEDFFLEVCDAFFPSRPPFPPVKIGASAGGETHEITCFLSFFSR